MAQPAAFFRLTGAGWALVRADALIPRELDPILPPSVRGLAKFIRLFSGPQAKRGRPGERLARALEGLGPVAIKLGQFLSTRADIFGSQFAQDLGRLKDRLPAFPTAVAKAQIAASLGKPVEALFASFGDPVAAASIAQAHPATLHDGRKVAVKVLRPGIEVRVAQESAALRLAARLAWRLIPAARRLEPILLVDTVLRALELELDLRLEAAGGDELGKVMALDGFMRAPKVEWDFVAKRTLTLDWAEGIALSEAGALIQPGLDHKLMADNLVRAFLSQALDHGVFHADLHEGNLFVAAPATITAIDFGIVGRLGPAERRYLAEILYGFLNRDYVRVAQVHFDAGYVPAHHDVHAFAQALRAVGEAVFGRPADQVSMGRLLAQLFEITALFEMRLRPELVLLQKTMVTVEGVARRIDPANDLWAAADPVVRRWIARELGPVTRARDFARDAAKAVKAIGRWADEGARPTVVAVAPSGRITAAGVAVGFACGALAAGAAFWLALVLR